MEQIASRRDALKKAIKIAGSQKKLAERVGTFQSQISYWLTRSKRGVAGEFAVPIEDATGVERHLLRPDLYPPENALQNETP